MRALPQKLNDRAELLMRSHPMGTVADLLGLHPSQLSRMKRRGFKEAVSGRPKRAMPSDFVVLAHRMTFRQLVDHYRTGNSTVKRWLKEMPNPPASRRGWALRKDPVTGRRAYELQP